jgi:hypothetical protein
MTGDLLQQKRLSPVNRSFDPLRSSPVGFGGLRVILGAPSFFRILGRRSGASNFQIVLDQSSKINGSKNFQNWDVMTKWRCAQSTETTALLAIVIADETTATVQGWR